MRSRVLILAALLVVGALAGCVSDEPAPDTSGTTGDGAGGDAPGGSSPDGSGDGGEPATGTGGEASPAEGRKYLTQAMAELAPIANEKLGMTLRMSEERGKPEAVIVDVAFDNSTRTMKWTITMKPENMPAEAQEGSEAAMFGAFADGLGVYARDTVVAFAVEKNLSVFLDRQGSYGPQSPDEPFFNVAAAEEGPLSLDAFLGALADAENLTVESVQLIQYNGRSAARITGAASDEDGAEGTGTLVVYLDPEPFPAYFEAEMPAEGDGFSPGYVRVDFARGDDVVIDFPEHVLRAMALVNEPEPQETTSRFTFYTPKGSPRIPLDEVRLEVREGGGFGDFGGFGGSSNSDSEGPVLSMLLSEGSASANNVTVTYDDKDGDGHVSNGDSYLLELHDEDAQVWQYKTSLHDEKTGYKVTPGFPALFAALAGLGAAIAFRRRG